MVAILNIGGSRLLVGVDVDGGIGLKRYCCNGVTFKIDDLEISHETQINCCHKYLFLYLDDIPTWRSQIHDSMKLWHVFKKLTCNARHIILYFFLGLTNS